MSHFLIEIIGGVCLVSTTSIAYEAVVLRAPVFKLVKSGHVLRIVSTMVDFDLNRRL